MVLGIVRFRRRGFNTPRCLLLECQPALVTCAFGGASALSYVMETFIITQRWPAPPRIYKPLF